MDMKLINGDCIEELKRLPDASIDMILTDLPYGTTACKWDSVIPFAPLWAEYNRVIKPQGAIVLFASQPFTTELIVSNRRGFKYELIWDKTYGRQPQLANIQPMKQHENILVFSKTGGKVKYNPQRVPLDKPYYSGGASNNAGSNNDHKLGLKKVAKTYTHKTPTSLLSYKPVNNTKTVHPTQKPTELLEWLIKSYSDEGDVVLDSCAGSGSTGVACANTNRSFIGIELDRNYYEIAKKRLEEAK